MKHLKKEEVTELLKNSQRSNRKFEDEIAQLKSGEGLQISLSEWTRKTSPTHYFPTKFNRGGQRVLSVAKITDGEFLVMKL